MKEICPNLALIDFQGRPERFKCNHPAGHKGDHAGNGQVWPNTDVVVASGVLAAPTT